MTCLYDGSALHRVARLIPTVALERGHELVEPVGPEPVPAGLVDDRGAWHDVDALVAHGSRSSTLRGRREPSRRPRPRRVRRTRSSSTSQRIEDASAGRGPRGDALAALVAAIAAPSPGRRGPAGSCRASRRPRESRRPASRGRGAWPSWHRDRLDERPRHDERQVADRRRPRRSCAPASIIDRPAPSRPRQAATPLDVGRHGERAPGTTTHGRSTNRSASRRA